MKHCHRGGYGAAQKSVGQQLSEQFTELKNSSNIEVFQRCTVKKCSTEYHIQNLMPPLINCSAAGVPNRQLEPNAVCCTCRRCFRRTCPLLAAARLLWKKFKCALHLNILITMADNFSTKATKSTEFVKISNGTYIPWTVANTGYRPATVPYVPNTTPQPVPESCAPGWVPFGPGACRKL